MHEQPWEERVGAVAALAEPVRRALYEHVAASADPVSRDAAADALQLPRSTAAFHLDRLAAEGLLAVEYRRLSGRTGPGAGRPAKLYRRLDTELTVSVPERRYDLVGQVLAAAIDESARSGESVHDILPTAARAAGREIGAGAGSLPAALDGYGFEARRDDNDGWVLRNCPFHRLAQRHTQLVCGLNLELLCGIADGAEDDQHTLVLDPAPGRCCVRIMPSPDDD